MERMPWGPALDENWQLKRSLVSNVSDAELDTWYERARSAGAPGGKILGAAAGGFLLVSASPDRHNAVHPRALAEDGSVRRAPTPHYGT